MAGVTPAGVTPAGATTRAWARMHGVSLAPADAEQIGADESLRRALADGVKRSGPADIDLPAAVDWYLVREQRRTVGALAVRRDAPVPGTAAIAAVAVAPAERGRACGTKALLAAERRLRAEGYAPVLASVPRTNGRGLYFMLRCGFVPLDERPPDPADVTWFGRSPRRRSRRRA